MNPPRMSFGSFIYLISFNVVSREGYVDEIHARKFRNYLNIMMTRKCKRQTQAKIILLPQGWVLPIRGMRPHLKPYKNDIRFLRIVT
jgi:hypothetical protein